MSYEVKGILYATGEIKRFKAVHLAEDLDVTPSKIHRFLNGKNVNDDFYQRWFSWYVKNQ